MGRLTLDLDSNLHSQLKVVAAKRGTSMREYCLEAIEAKIAEEPPAFLTAAADAAALTELWDNDDDAVYDDM